MQGYLGSQSQLERGALGSVVIAGRGKNEVVSNLVLWELKHGKRSVKGWAHTFVDLLEANTRVLSDCLPATMDDRLAGEREPRRSTKVCPIVVVVVALEY